MIEDILELENIIINLTLIYKIELGDDVLAEIQVLKSEKSYDKLKKLYDEQINQIKEMVSIS